MTREETKKIVMVIAASYPNWHPQDMSFTVDAWNLMLAEYDYSQIALALKAYIATDTSGFAPSVGQVIDKLYFIGTPEELNEMEAWALVSNALRNGCYGAEDEFNRLPPLVQKAVGTPSQLRHWSQTDTGSIESVVQSNFMRTYRTVLNRKKELSRMPGEVRDMIAATNAKMIGSSKHEDNQ